MISEVRYQVDQEEPGKLGKAHYQHTNQANRTIPFFFPRPAIAVEKIVNCVSSKGLGKGKLIKKKIMLSENS